MDNEAAVFEAIRKLTYAEMVALGGLLRGTAECGEFDPSDANDWARVLQEALDAFDDRED